MTPLASHAHTSCKLHPQHCLCERIPDFRTKDVDNITNIHVKLIDLSPPGYSRYIFHAGKISVNWVVNKVRAKYPDLRSRVPDGGKGDDWPVPMAKYDLSKSDEVFSTNWKGWWNLLR